MKIVEGLLHQPDARPVKIEGQKDDVFYMNVSKYFYEWTGDDGNRYMIEVNAGFIYDGGSVPGIATFLLKLRRDGLGRPAFLVHDEIFRKGGKGVNLSIWRNGIWRKHDIQITFEQTNRLFCRMLGECGVSDRDKRIMYKIVDSYFGRRHFGKPCPGLK